MQHVSFVTALSPAAVVECAVNVGFLRDKAAVLGAVINERPCIMQRNPEHFWMWIGRMVTD